MKICIVVPMYNEQAIAEKSVTTILCYTRQLPTETTLLVVNDGSQDNTGKILDDLSSRHHQDGFMVLTHKANKGYGAALRSGIDYAISNAFDYVLFMDSDLTNDPAYIEQFYRKMLEGYDYIKATRYAGGGRMEGVPFKRRIISRCGNIFARMVMNLPLTDITNGFRAVKTDILRRITLQENHFAIIIEELAKSARITNSFCEIPNTLGTRTKDAAATKFRYNIPTFYKYLRYLFI